MSFTKNNHYCPVFYLRSFAYDEDRVYRYRTLVSRKNVPEWKSASVGGLAYGTHLYTRYTMSGESDVVERWLEREFDSPAAKPIKKAVSNQKLERED